MIDDLLARYEGLSAEALLADFLGQFAPGKVALVSSFGTESAVLLHLVAQIDPATPVLFLETGKHFGETLRYRRQLAERFGLTDVRDLRPSPEIAAEDADGFLFQRDADRCCYLRKVVPLKDALAGFDGWINGRKGSHGGSRAALPPVEADGPRLKLTPLHRWSQADLDAYFTKHDLPRHPLQEDGFTSIGCFTCTERASGDDPRGGRWAGKNKTECGIHTL